jgi:hypothetical protein
VRNVPGLDGIESGAGDSDVAASRNWHLTRRDNRHPATRLGAISGRGCWCGDPNGHDWPGKDEGAPHPRVLPEGLRRSPAPWQKGVAEPAGSAA